MWKNLENFSKSIQILVSGSEVWTCNLMITSLVSYPLDHRGKLEKFAVYVCFINKIWKYPFLANEIYNPQTHFGFTNLWSNMPRYWVASSQKVKNGTRTPCTVGPYIVSHSHVVSFSKSFLIILSKIRAHPLFLAVVVRILSGFNYLSSILKDSFGLQRCVGLKLNF